MGLDILRKNLKKTKALHKQIHVICGDVEHLPIIEIIIDYVLSFGLLHHLPNQEKASENGKIPFHYGWQPCAPDGLGPIYPLWRLTLLESSLRGHFAEGMYSKLHDLEKYLRQKGFSVDVRAEQSFLFGLSCLLDLYAFLEEFFLK